MVDILPNAQTCTMELVCDVTNTHIGIQTSRKPFKFSISWPQRKKPLIFQAENEDEQVKWVQALRRCTHNAQMPGRPIATSTHTSTTMTRGSMNLTTSSVRTTVVMSPSKSKENDASGSATGGYNTKKSPISPGSKKNESSIYAQYTHSQAPSNTAASASCANLDSCVAVEYDSDDCLYDERDENDEEEAEAFLLDLRSTNLVPGQSEDNDNNPNAGAVSDLLAAAASGEAPTRTPEEQESRSTPSAIHPAETNRDSTSSLDNPNVTVQTQSGSLRVSKEMAQEVEALRQAYGRSLQHQEHAQSLVEFLICNSTCADCNNDTVW
jgi:hypothetical protein